MNFSGVSNRSLVGRVLRFPLRLIPPTLVVPILQGPLRGRRWIVGSTNHGAWLGSYELSKQKRFVEVATPGQVVYDIGANVGLYTLLASQAVTETGAVVAFEPVPANLAFLRRHLELNKFSSVEVVTAAVADADGKAKFSVPPSRNGSLDEAGSLEVEQLSLDSYMRRSGSRPPSVLKIDVEGAELAVLRGARETLSRYQPSIFLATHSEQLKRDCHQLLDELGYSIEVMVDDPRESIAIPANVSTRI